VRLLLFSLVLTEAEVSAEMEILKGKGEGGFLDYVTCLIKCVVLVL
jgi:hypothetical protein